MTGDAPNQVETMRDALPAPGAENPDAPRMPFQTSYVLTREQEDALTTHVQSRIRQISEQMGRDADMQAEKGNLWGNTIDAGSGQGHWAGEGYNPESFLGKRERFTLRYYSQVGDRAQPGTIYKESNLTLPLAQRICRQAIAKSLAYFFGQPDDIDWFSSEAVGLEDEATSDKIKKHSRWKVDQCEVKDRFIEAMEWARVRGEAVVKVTHQKRSQIYKRTATILVDEAGEPILDAHGDYIVQGDATVAEMSEAPPPGLVTRAVGAVADFFLGPPAGAAQPGVGNTGAPPVGDIGQNLQNEQNSGGVVDPNSVDSVETPLEPTGRQILKRDGVTVLPEQPIWEEQVIARQLVTFDGPDVRVVFYKDFGCPLDATDVQTADLVFHTYDRSVMEVAQMFRGQYGEGDAAIADMTAAVERLRDLLNASAQPKAGANQPRAELGEKNTDPARANPSCEVAEVCLCYDADGDGMMEEIFLLLDRKTGAPIYYEYLANVTVRGERPFQVWRPRAIDGRWYGMGDMEYLDKEQEFIDLQVNRYNFANSKAGRVTFWDPSLTLEGATDPNLLLNDGGTYRKKQNVKTEDVLSYVQIPDDAQNREFLLNLFIQFGQLKSGVINGADRSVTDMPSSETLGEEELITQSGDELFAHTIATLFPAVKDSLGAVLDVIYANMNRVEVFNYFNGEANEILSLTPEDVRDLALNVTLSLSRTQARKTLQMGEQAQQIVDWFYALPLPLQEKLAVFCRQRLKGLGVGQADKIIEPLDPMLLAPPMAPGEAPALPPPATSAV